MKRRRERQYEWLAISSSCDICFFFQRSGGVVALRVKATFGRQAAGLSGGHRPPLQKSQQAGSLCARRARGPSSLCAIRAVRARTKNRDAGAPRPCFVGRMFRLFDHKTIFPVPYFPTTA